MLVTLPVYGFFLRWGKRILIYLFLRREAYDFADHVIEGMIVSTVVSNGNQPEVSRCPNCIGNCHELAAMMAGASSSRAN